MCVCLSPSLFGLTISRVHVCLTPVSSDQDVCCRRSSLPASLAPTSRQASSFFPLPLPPLFAPRHSPAAAVASMHVTLVLSHRIALRPSYPHADAGMQASDVAACVRVRSSSGERTRVLLTSPSSPDFLDCLSRLHPSFLPDSHSHSYAISLSLPLPSASPSRFPEFLFRALCLHLSLPRIQQSSL